MKIVTSSKNIRSVDELAGRFREFIPVDPNLNWRVQREGPSGFGLESCDRIELALDGKKLPFRALYELKPSLPWLQSLQPPQDLPTLLVTPELSNRVLDACKRHGIAAIDLNGRTWLRAPGILVDRQALPGRSFRHTLEPRNIFVGKSARIVRCLLTDRDRIWAQSEVISRTGATSGLVSRIFQYLVSQGFLEKTKARAYRLREPMALLDEWAASDRLAKRTRTAHYAGYLGSPIELAHHLQQWARDHRRPIAFTQWVAAWARSPFTEPVVCSAYVPRLPDPGNFEQLGLRPVEEGGRLWLLVPEDEGVLTETQLRGDLTLATDAQIYLDLQRTGLRGPEAADALKNSEGFCLP